MSVIEKKGEEAGGGSERLDVSNELTLLSSMLLPECVMNLIKPDAPITIIPHLALNGVPFAALPISEGGSGTTSKPLVESHALAYAPSLTCLKQLHQRAEFAKSCNVWHNPPPSLIIGGAYTARAFELPSIPESEVEAKAIANKLNITVPKDDEAFANLMNNKSEASKEFVASKGKLLVGAHATAESLGRLLATQPLRLLHLACHSRPNCLALGKMEHLTEEGAKLVQAAAAAAAAANEAVEASEATVDVSDGAAEGGSGGKPLSAEEAALQAQARIDAAKAAWAVAAQAEVDAEAEMEAELGPTASGILAIEALAELPTRTLRLS